jgi:hypothetical protein
MTRGRFKLSFGLGLMGVGCPALGRLAAFGVAVAAAVSLMLALGVSGANATVCRRRRSDVPDSGKRAGWAAADPGPAGRWRDAASGRPDRRPDHALGELRHLDSDQHLRRYLLGPPDVVGVRLRVPGPAHPLQHWSLRPFVRRRRKDRAGRLLLLERLGRRLLRRIPPLPVFLQPRQQCAAAPALRLVGRGDGAVVQPRALCADRVHVGGERFGSGEFDPPPQLRML